RTGGGYSVGQRDRPAIAAVCAGVALTTPATDGIDVGVGEAVVRRDRSGGRGRSPAISRARADPRRASTRSAGGVRVGRRLARRESPGRSRRRRRGGGIASIAPVA